MRKMLTVFTPTYNRAYSLPRTYQSLINQTVKDFIWLIVDDGSTDNTQTLVSKWQGENSGFEIHYLYKENGGMHTAHNVAYENIDTELNVCIDSDDLMPPYAVELIINTWKKTDAKKYAGIMGLDADLNYKIIGKGFPEGLKCSTVSGYYDRGGSGDKKLVYRTEIMKRYPPYPAFEGEKYFSLAYKYLLCDQEFKMIVLNKVLCLVEYQGDGSTKNMFRQYLRNPRGFAEWRKIRMNYDRSFLRLLIDCIHYCSSSQIAGLKHYVRKSPYKALTVLCMPIGRVLTFYVKRKAMN